MVASTHQTATDLPRPEPLRPGRRYTDLLGGEVSQRLCFADRVIGGLSEANRTKWEVFLMTATDGRRFRDELYAEIDTRAEARGIAAGEARAVLVVLQSRSVPVPDAVREKILACADTDQLDLWLRRAVAATTVNDVIRD